MKGEGIGSQCNFAKTANDDVDTCCKEHDMYCPRSEHGAAFRTCASTAAFCAELGSNLTLLQVLQQRGRPNTRHNLQRENSQVPEVYPQAQVA